MGGMFDAPQAQQEDPTVRKFRRDQQARAEEDRLQSIQAKMSLDTRMRTRAFGIHSLLGASIPLASTSNGYLDRITNFSR
jgi:hypothetical protein